jgi:hypothetical protein
MSFSIGQEKANAEQLEHKLFLYQTMVNAAVEPITLWKGGITMIKRALLAVTVFLMLAGQTIAQEPFEKDTIRTSKGDLEITFIGHGTLMMACQGKTIHIDPFSRLADYTNFPKADIIFLTHHHRDHLDVDALNE